MPIYEYKCPDCKKIVEKRQTIEEREREKLVCDECKRTLKPLISFSSFILTGDGWYKKEFK
jgi:putative FmdB family regulatory protein